MKCPFCLNPIADSNPGEKICLNCHTEFEIDDRGECVFANPDNLKLPVNGTLCSVCGLVQGEGRDSCGYCGAESNVLLH
jgi:hypothetical protein